MTTTAGDLLCNGIITVNTEGNKRAKQDFSSVAFTGLSPIDISGGTRRLYSVDVGDFTGLVVTGSNGAWGKSDNIKDITLALVSGSLVCVCVCTVNGEVPMGAALTFYCVRACV